MIRYCTLVVCLGIAVMLAVGCGVQQIDDPRNPSFRVVTDQVLQIDSALGPRGGLPTLVQTSSGPEIPSVAAVCGVAPPPPPKKELNWRRIESLTSTIENAWIDIEKELERRRINEIDESWNELYLDYFENMAAVHDFETSLEALKLDIATKNEERVALSVAMVAASHIQVKTILYNAQIDSGRMILMSTGLVGTVIVLTLGLGWLGRHRDRKMMKAPPPDNGS